MLDKISDILKNLESLLTSIISEVSNMGVFGVLKWASVIVLAAIILFLIFKVLSEVLKEATKLAKHAIKWSAVLFFAAILLVVAKHIADENRTCWHEYEKQIWHCK